MTKSSLPKAVALLAMAASLSACERIARQELREDRAGHLYQAAMADYTAGRIDAAIDGFEKVVRATPGNASARFQLATLLQDRRHDYLAALCQYREYVLQSPSSDKAELARERASVCERQYAASILEKLKDGEGPVAAEISRLKSELEKTSQANEKLRADLADALQEVAASKRESERVRRLVTSLGDEESLERPAFFGARELLDGEDDESGERVDLASAKRLLEDEKEDSVDRVKLSADVAMLVAEEKSEHAQTPFAVAPKKQPVPGGASRRDEAPHEARPAEYVVQEGDTLYKIAMRFYGRRSAWTKIRDANKTVISMDGRVNAGERIVLPE